MGRHRQPNKIHELKGNPSKRPLPKEPELSNVSFTPPTKLTKRAKVFWKELTGAMPDGIFKVTDRHLLCAYCEQAATHEEATAEIEKGGAVVKGSQGQPVVSPWVKIRNEAASKLVTIGAKLGLSPVDRAGIGAGDTTPTIENKFIN